MGETVIFSEYCNHFMAGNVSAFADCAFVHNFAGGFARNIGGIMFITGIIILFLSFFAIIYIYHSLAWFTIAKKLKYKNHWLAWIPFASAAMRLHLGKIAWQWIFLVLIPIFGWLAIFILLIIAHWRIFEKRKYPGWFSLASIVPYIGGILYLIAIGFVAWEDRRKFLFR